MTVTRLTKWASSYSVLFFSLRVRFSLVVLAIRLALSFSFWHTHTHTQWRKKGSSHRLWLSGSDTLIMTSPSLEGLCSLLVVKSITIMMKLLSFIFNLGSWSWCKLWARLWPGFTTHERLLASALNIHCYIELGAPICNFPFRKQWCIARGVAWGAQSEI